MLNRFGPYFRLLIPLKWAALGGLLSGIIASGMNGFGFPFIIHEVLPKVFPDDGSSVDRAQLVLYVLLIPMVFVVRGGFGFLNLYLVTFCGTRVLEKVRLQVFDRLLRLPLAFFHRSQSGDLYSRVMSDTSEIQKVVVNNAANLVQLPVQLLGAIGFVVWYCAVTPNMLVFLAWLAGVPIFILPIAMIGKKVKRRSRELQEHNATVSSNLIEGLQAPQDIRVFNLQEAVHANFTTKIRELIRSQLKVVKYMGAISPIIEILSAVGFCGALYYAGLTSISLKELVPLMVALHMAYEPMKKIGQTYHGIKRAEASLDRLEYILDEPDSMPDPATPQPLDNFVGELEFRGVDFSYNDNHLVLRDLNLAVHPGEVIALVGPSGAGKSTFTNLIPRLFDPTAGAILLDGHPLPRYAKRELRECVSLVSQEPILFNDSIGNNIRVGRSGATEEEVVAAAKAAFAHDFILEFENGYDTVVGERGGSLSGGQRQRIAIARAFLRGAPILILDESTSALDSESEVKIQQALADLVKGKTVFIIAHRFSTTQVASRVLVFEEGRIIADGPHDKVYETCSVYRTLYDFQTTLEH